MNALSPSGAESPITSAIHLEFIRTVVEDGGEGGAEAVEAFHRALFLNRHGPDLERFRQDRAGCEERLEALEHRLRRTQGRLEGEDALVAPEEDGVRDVRPTAPWNGWDRTMFAVAVLAIAGLLVFGVLNVSFNLLESGIVTFAEHPARAYFWAALLPVGALAVKVGWGFLGSPRIRRIYLWTCLAAGLAGVLTWVAAYASIYPSLSRTAIEQVGTLDVFNEGAGGGLTAGGVKWVDMILVASQAVAEIFLSAALGMYLTQLYARHRPVRLAVNPVHRQFDAERRRLEEEMSKERRALAEARGGEARLENQLAVFVAYARSLFRKEAALRHDRTDRKRRLIEDVAVQLRDRLEALEAPDPELPEPEGGNGNGNGRTLKPAPEGEVR